MLKKILAIAIMTITIFTLCGFENNQEYKLLNDKEINAANIIEMLAEIQETYPNNKELGMYYHGMYSPVRVVTKTYPAYNRADKTHWRKNSISTVKGCAGWVSRVSDMLISNDILEFYKLEDIQTAQPGDMIIEINQDQEALHVMLITGTPEINSDKNKISFPITEAGVDKNGTYRIYWNHVFESDLKAPNCHVYSRYPKEGN